MFRRGDGEGPHAHWPGTPAFGLVLAITVAFGSAIALLYSPLASAQGEVCPSASDHNYMGQYPSDREGPWSEEAQGVAHDHTNWFLTQRSRLIKFPVDFDISSNRGDSAPFAQRKTTRARCSTSRRSRSK